MTTTGGREGERISIQSPEGLKRVHASCPWRITLQSELQVTMETPGVNGMQQMRLRGYVVRIDSEAEKGQTAVGVVFTD